MQDLLADPNLSFDSGSVTVDGTADSTLDITTGFTVDVPPYDSVTALAGQTTISFTVTVADPLPAGVVSVSNQATVDGEDTCDPANLPEECTPTVFPTEAQLRATKAVTEADPDGFAYLGEILTFTITIYNDGGSSASDTFLDTLSDPNLSFVPNSVLIDGVANTSLDVTTGFSVTVPPYNDTTSTPGQTVIIFDAQVADPIDTTNGFTIENQAKFGDTLTCAVPDTDGDPSTCDPTSTPTYNTPDNLAQLSGNVWYDKNQDVLIDTGEIGIPNVEMILVGMDQFGNYYGPDATLYPAEYAWFTTQFSVTNTDPAFITSPVELTDTNGFYRFDALLPGVYSVLEIQPPAYASTGSDTSTDVVPAPQHGEGSVQSGSFVDANRITDVVLNALDHSQNNNFGENLGIIGNQVFVDADEDGNFGAGDIPFPGVAVELYEASGTAVGYAITDVNGEYQFSDLPILDDTGNPITYVVRISGGQPILFSFTESLGSNPGVNNNSQDHAGYNVTLTEAAQTNFTADFGYNRKPNPTSSTDTSTTTSGTSSSGGSGGSSGTSGGSRTTGSRTSGYSSSTGRGSSTNGYGSTTGGSGSTTGTTTGNQTSGAYTPLTVPSQPESYEPPTVPEAKPEEVETFKNAAPVAKDDDGAPKNPQAPQNKIRPYPVLPERKSNNLEALDILPLTGGGE